MAERATLRSLGRADRVSAAWMAVVLLLMAGITRSLYEASQREP